MGPGFPRGQCASSSVGAGVVRGAGFPGPHAWGCWRFRVHGCVLCVCSLQVMLVVPSAPRGDIPASAGSRSKGNEWQAVSGEVPTFSAPHSGPQRRQFRHHWPRSVERKLGDSPHGRWQLSNACCASTLHVSVYFCQVTGQPGRAGTLTYPRITLNGLAWGQ